MQPLHSVLVAALLGAAGCVAPPSPPAVTTLPGEAARIHLNVPAFAEVQPLRRVFQTPEEREEYALYVRADGTRAEIILVQSTGGDVALNLPEGMRTLDGTIPTWAYNTGSVAATGELRQASLRRNALLYRTYRNTRDGRDCVAFKAEWDSWSDDPKRRPTNWLLGYACAAPGEAMTPSAAARIVDGLSVAPPSAVARTTKPGDPLGIPPGAGNVEYPMRIARHFTPRNGNSDNRD